MNNDRAAIDDDDEFEDAYNIVMPSSESMDFETALHDAELLVNLFLNNQFQEAKDMTKPWVGKSLYHTVADSLFTFLDALLTNEPENMLKASDALENSMRLCCLLRKKSTFFNSVGKLVVGTNYDHYSKEEIHAELCYAESLFMKALLVFIEDKSLVGCIKAGFKIKSCFNSYKDCQTILNTKDWTNDHQKADFESGVRLGIGGFNLLISLLPSTFIKLLEFIGFSGSKEVGINELIKCYSLHEGLRHIFSALSLLSYNLIVINTLSHCEGDFQLCEDILNRQFTMYPNSVLFLYFKGRLEFMRGNISEASDWYIKSWKAQSVWPQLHHLCFWDLMWTQMIVQDWKEAEKYIDMLLRENKVSITIFSYQKASIMLMRHEELTADEKNEVSRLMSDVPKHKQSIAGQSLPVELFYIKKAERYDAQMQFLVLPGLELLFIWNQFKVISKKRELSVAMLDLIDSTLKDVEKGSLSTPYGADNLGLVLLLKGVCLHLMMELLPAKETLKRVLLLEKNIKEDNYLIPHALVQLAVVYHKQGDINKAMVLLKKAKENYSGYSLEFELQFQIHSTLSDFRREEQNSALSGNQNSMASGSSP